MPPGGSSVSGNHEGGPHGSEIEEAFDEEQAPACGERPGEAEEEGGSPLTGPRREEERAPHGAQGRAEEGRSAASGGEEGSGEEARRDERQAGRRPASAPAAAGRSTRSAADTGAGFGRADHLQSELGPERHAAARDGALELTRRTRSRPRMPGSPPAHPRLCGAARAEGASPTPGLV